jgi:hypothetical protein
LRRRSAARALAAVAGHTSLIGNERPREPDILYKLSV